MTLARARIIKANPESEWPTVPNLAGSRARIVRAELLDAHAEALAIRQRAKQEAQEIVDVAKLSAESIKESARAQGREQGFAEAAAHAVLLLEAENKADERAQERIIAFATLLAERLLGKSLTSDPETAVHLAQELLREARGARRVTLATHPEDARRLAKALDVLPLGVELSVIGQAELGRGDFQLHTDVGTLSGSLGERLELLAEKLKQGTSRG